MPCLAPWALGSRVRYSQCPRHPRPPPPPPPSLALPPRPTCAPPSCERPAALPVPLSFFHSSRGCPLKRSPLPNTGCAPKRNGPDDVDLAAHSESSSTTPARSPSARRTLAWHGHAFWSSVQLPSAGSPLAGLGGRVLDSSCRPFITRSPRVAPGSPPDGRFLSIRVRAPPTGSHWTTPGRLSPSHPPPRRHALLAAQYLLENKSYQCLLTTCPKMDPNAESTINPADLHNDFFGSSYFDNTLVDVDGLPAVLDSLPPSGAPSFDPTEDFANYCNQWMNTPTPPMKLEEFDTLFDLHDHSLASNTPSPSADPVFSQANSPGDFTRDKSHTGSSSPATSHDVPSQDLLNPIKVEDAWSAYYATPDALHIPQTIDTPQVHIVPDKTKTRAETQIKVQLTLDPLDQRYEYIHFPRKSLAKPKLLASADERKDIEARGEALHLELLLVCAMAVEKPERLEEALRRGRGEEPAPRRPANIPVTEVDKEDPAHPQNGGEVIICEGCKERERKRYDRKKKRAEDEDEWWEYESERVIMINEKEYKKWKDLEAGDHTHSASAKQVEFAMRIACYCRHQEEKTPAGYRVIFTFKDRLGDLVAQQASDIFLITDDHKNKDSSTELPRILTGHPSYMPPGFHPNVVPIYQYPNQFAMDQFNQAAPMSAYSQPVTPLTPLVPNFHTPISPSLEGHFPQGNTGTGPPLPPQATNQVYHQTAPMPTAFSRPPSQGYFETPMMSPSAQASPESYLTRPVSMDNFNFTAGMHYGNQGYASAPPSAVSTPISLSRPASPSWDQGPTKKKMLKPSWIVGPGY
ncbi:hypothetical protein P154DRAFT_525034 [Amniculicola lignicola CBS 123094]|uniref:SPT23/MGA2-like DNA-binding domain-containing protein n=1 Tax=Amniculicola lignicola CBS 123094 TaxID=1392246 RepID=A0A6A5W7A8_9PLEO|nr:hypothetical protein P154DRAFT_525034 [Amniculicola lignicola CBS 123094]